MSFAPEGGSVNADLGTVTNSDYRTANIPVASSAAYAVGDVVEFVNDPAGTPVTVERIGLADKSENGAAFTAKIVGIPNGTTITIFQKPIALDDPALSSLEQAYANVNTQILSGAEVRKLNTSEVNGARANIFWAKDSIKMIGGEAPWELMNEYGGMKVITADLGNGLTAYMVYDGNIVSGTFTWRFFVWYGLSNFNPLANGVGVTYRS